MTDQQEKNTIVYAITAMLIAVMLGLLVSSLWGLASDDNAKLRQSLIPLAQTKEPQTQEQTKLGAEALKRNRAKAAARVKAEARPKHDECSAYTMAQDFVTSRLKCPSTAKWPGFWAGVSYSEITFHLGGGKYRISSYLDAQNGFGAMVRVNFICVVEHVGGSRWRLVSLTM
ncbi:hypothetical protein LCGC14_0599600 [marine sediment metagenome]|uniref:Uncharacterized protein n=1 Tax=marine sediment metagenome TaxID=412755 RepID=A0A0F9RB26_9ZZZZ